MKQTSFYNSYDIEESDLDMLVAELVDGQQKNEKKSRSQIVDDICDYKSNANSYSNSYSNIHKSNIDKYDIHNCVMSGNFFPIANNYIDNYGEIDIDIAQKMLIKLNIEPANDEITESKEEIYVMKEILLAKNMQLWKNILFCNNFMSEKPKYIYDPVYEDITSIKIAFAIVHNIKSHKFKDIMQLLKTCVTLNNINIYQEYPTFSSLGLMGKKTDSFFVCEDIESLLFCLELISICRDINPCYFNFLIESNIELILSCDDVYPYYQYLKHDHLKSLSLSQLITLTNHFSEINEIYTDLIHKRISHVLMFSSFSQLISILQLSKHSDSLPPPDNQHLSSFSE